MNIVLLFNLWKIEALHVTLLILSEIRKGTLQMFGLVVLREEFWVKDDLQRSIECLGSTSMFNSLKFCIICSSCFFEPTVWCTHWNFVLYVPHVSLNLYCMFYSLKFCFKCSSCFFEPTVCFIHWNFVLYVPHVSLNLLYVLFTEI